MANRIIYYNAVILSDLLTHSDFSGDAARVAMLSLVSAEALQHINFYGRYEFGKQPELIDMKAVMRQLAVFISGEF